MPIRQNTHNDPAIGEALSGIAQLFAPPGAKDMAAYAVAKQKKEEAERLAELYNYSKDPNYDQTRADRMAVMGGLYNPSGSYYAVDQGNATTRRGQDVASQTQLATNANTVRGSTIGQLYGPLSQGQVRPDVPVEVAGTIGLPAMSAVQGAPKPLNESEFKAQEQAKLRGSGQITDQMLVDAIVGEKAPVPGVDPVTGKAKYMSPGEAVRTGAQPAPKEAEPSPLARLIKERDALPEGDPRRVAYDQNIAALGRGQQQSKYDQAADEAAVKLNEEIFTNANRSLADRGTYNAVLAAVNNPNVDQGVLAEATLAVRKTLNAFGVDGGATGPSEMLNALGNQISLKLRDPSNGAGMPGAMSDADRNFLKSMSISLGNSRQANELLAKYYMAVQQRAIDLNDLRQNYIAKNGRIDEGFKTAMAEYYKNNDPTRELSRSLSGGAPMTPPVAASPTVPTQASPAESPKRLRFNENGELVQ